MSTADEFKNLDEIPAAVFVVDLSAIRGQIQALMGQKIPSSISNDAVTELLTMIPLLFANKEALRTVEVEDQSEIPRAVQSLFVDVTFHSVLKSFADIFSKGESELDTQFTTLKSKTLKYVRYKWRVASGCEDTWSRVYIVVHPQPQERLVSQIDEMTHIFEAVLEGIQIAVSYIDGAGHFKRSLGSILRRFGVSEEYLLGKQIRDMYSHRVRYIDDALIRRKHTSFFDSAKERGMTDQEWFFQSFLIPEQNGGMYFVTIDVSELQKTQQNLEQSKRKLMLSHDDLEQFAQIVSHDLREPIRTIALYIELLSAELAGHSVGKAPQYLQVIDNSANRMHQLITDLAQFNQVRRGTDPQAVDLNKAVTGALSDLKSSFTDSKATIHYDALPVVSGDETRARLLFQNLISNALKYTSGQPKITISAELTDRYWCLAMQDTGIGIEPRYHERVFEMFRRLHSRDDYGGTGMGLAICKKIVEQWGGSIWVESDGKNGSVFKFTVPAWQKK